MRYDSAGAASSFFYYYSSYYSLYFYIFLSFSRYARFYSYFFCLKEGTTGLRACGVDTGGGCNTFCRKGAT
jgi:hypothetical protein